MPNLDPSLIDADADRVVRKLAKAGFKAYLVGGCVRDLLVGRKPKDFDVATSATPNEIRNLFRNCRIIGRRFRLAHIVFGTKIIETSTFRANPRDGDESDGELLIRRDNVFGSESEDARRRDFTINGLFYDVEAQRVIDHVGGLPDLQRQLIRTIGDPDIRFQEDPIRILRGLKFAARLGFGFENHTFEALLRWRGEISKCAPPRITEEIYRMLRGGAAASSFELLVKTDVLGVMSRHLAGLLQGDGAPFAPTSGKVVAPPKSTVRRAESEFGEADEMTDDNGEVGLAEEPDQFEHGQQESWPPLREDLDLDAEELRWRQVWADSGDRPGSSGSRRMSEAPVAIDFSFLRGSDLSKARSRAWLALPVIDSLVAENSEISNAAALGSLLFPFLPTGERKGNDFHAAIHELVHPVINELRVTRRDSERIRFILMAQRKLINAVEKGLRPQLFGGSDLIRDAAGLYRIGAQASGLAIPDEIVAMANDGERDDTSPADSGEASDDDQAPRKKRRRRRGGRFR